MNAAVVDAGVDLNPPLPNLNQSPVMVALPPVAVVCSSKPELPSPPRKPVH